MLLARAFSGSSKAQSPLRALMSEQRSLRTCAKRRPLPFWGGTNTRDVGKVDSCEDYFNELERAESGMGNLELHAAAEIFGLTIVVVPQLADHQPVKFGEGSFKIALWFSGAHYSRKHREGFFRVERRS
ncbi:unnamed protein product [Symbiodinium sp. CCMP2592]|nr:unnamed protein product [Symbiodinium sp. CCMP2592]